MKLSINRFVLLQTDSDFYSFNLITTRDCEWHVSNTYDGSELVTFLKKLLGMKFKWNRTLNWIKPDNEHVKAAWLLERFLSALMLMIESEKSPKTIFTKTNKAKSKREKCRAHGLAREEPWTTRMWFVSSSSSTSLTFFRRECRRLSWDG